MAFENLFIRTERTIGGIQLDAILSEKHSSPVSLTKNPVEAGSDITDHAIIQPVKLNIRGTVTDTPLGTAALGQIIDSITGLFGTSNSSNISRSQQAYEALIALKNAREPLIIETKLRTYSNMIITDLPVTQDKDSSRVIIFDMSLEEVILTESATVDLSESDLASSVSKSATPTVNKGRQKTQNTDTDTNSSILKTIGGWLGG